ncbi:MAG: hypothetical protein ACR2MO_11240 [Acidimicrobiales bacterium]
MSTGVEHLGAEADPVEGPAPKSVANRLADLLKSLDWYDKLSNGVGDEVRRIVPWAPERVAELDDDEVRNVWFDVVNVLRSRRLEPVLALHGLPHPRYPMGTDDRAHTAPPPVVVWDSPRMPEPAPGGWSVLGFDVGFPIGIPSCELTCNADWIEYYALKGFHVLTYRTVRSRATPGSPYDWVFLAGIDRPWALGTTPHEVRRANDQVPRDWRAVSTATSFAAPCPSPETWERDVADARRRLDRLGGNHILIVSVTDSVPREQKSVETLCADFVDVAARAEKAGAHAVECYLARATMRDGDGQLAPCEQSTETSIAIVRAVRATLDKATPLVIKLSGDLPPETLEAIVVPLAQEGLIDGVSGISPMKVDRVTTGPDNSSLWRERPPAVAGYALHDLSRAFVERLVRIRRAHALEFDILAMGGVMTVEDVADYLRLGACAVQTATAAVSDPGLARDAFLHYRPTVQSSEDWDGVVMDIDEDAGTFWAGLSRADADAPDEEAEFQLGELHADQRAEVRPGAVFRWRIAIIEDAGELVHRSSLSFRRLPPPSEDDRLSGSRLAGRVAEVFGLAPDFPVD